MKKFLLAFLITIFSAYPATAQTKPFVLGVVEEIRSAILGENRTLNIYLPAGYRPGDTARYPVIYLLDGAADEDFIHIAGLVQFFNFPWINTVPPSIVVGIANVNRQRDFTTPATIDSVKRSFPNTGGSAAFISFIEKELQPFIENKYRTAPARTLIGQSLGGLLATEILFSKPALFDNYIIVSPSLWWNDGALLAASPAIEKPGFSQQKKIYIGVGKEGAAPGNHIMEEDAQKLADKIRKAENKNISVFFDYLPNETHATVSHQAVFNAFRLLYSPK